MAVDYPYLVMIVCGEEKAVRAPRRFCSSAQCQARSFAAAVIFFALRAASMFPPPSRLPTSYQTRRPTSTKPASGAPSQATKQSAPRAAAIHVPSWP
jgi:hypothetical protein